MRVKKLAGVGVVTWVLFWILGGWARQVAAVIGLVAILGLCLTTLVLVYHLLRKEIPR